MGNSTLGLDLGAQVFATLCRLMNAVSSVGEAPAAAEIRAWCVVGASLPRCTLPESPAGVCAIARLETYSRVDRRIENRNRPAAVLRRAVWRAQVIVERHRMVCRDRSRCEAPERRMAHLPRITTPLCLSDHISTNRRILSTDALNALFTACEPHRVMPTQHAASSAGAASGRRDVSRSGAYRHGVVSAPW